MAILTKGQTFANADSVTSTKLNNLVDAAAFVAGASGTTDNTSLEVNGSGRLQVKDLGITSAKLAAGAVTTTKLPDSTIATDGVTYTKLQRVANMKALGNVSGSLGVASEISILDEDDMVSNSATALATQQSIKGYVDSTFVLGTSVASTSGTSIDFTGIPSTAKRVTVSLAGVSTNGGDGYLFQIGDSGGIKDTGYLGSSTNPAIGGVAHTTGFGSNIPNNTASVVHGSITISKISGNQWVAAGVFSRSDAAGSGATTGTKTLSDTLDRVRITTTGGTNTFDLGTVNISYE